MADLRLEPHPTIPVAEGPVLVVILDGFGENEFKDQFNAVFTAPTPNVDKLRAVASRSRTVQAHGRAVGLPSDADMGNSEVGHNALGAGQVVDQGARLVDIALETGKMFEGPGWKLISQAFPAHTLHFIGLLSDGGVHSRFDQLIGTLKVRRLCAARSWRRPTLASAAGVGVEGATRKSHRGGAGWRAHGVALRRVVVRAGRGGARRQARARAHFD